MQKENPDVFESSVTLQAVVSQSTLYQKSGTCIRDVLGEGARSSLRVVWWGDGWVGGCGCGEGRGSGLT